MSETYLKPYICLESNRFCQRAHSLTGSNYYFITLTKREFIKFEENLKYGNPISVPILNISLKSIH